MNGNCPPYQCPKCGRYLNFNIDYFCGSPNIHYTCICGYDTNEEYTIATTNTPTATPMEVDMNQKYIPMPYYYTTNWNGKIVIK